MQDVLLFFSLLLLLFFLAKRLQQRVYAIIFVLTRHHTFSIHLLASLLLPGTILHELSHFFAAIILGISVHDVSIFPTIDRISGEIRAGHVTIGRTDPLRATLIGIAPIIIGLLLLTLINVLFPELSSLTIGAFEGITTLGIYGLFVVSTTMFSSKKDLESLTITGPILILLISALYVIGIRISFSSSLTQTIIVALQQLNRLLATCAVINTILLLMTAGIFAVGKRYFRH